MFFSNERSITYGHIHRVIFHEGSIKSSESNQEYDDTSRNTKRRQGEKSFRHKRVVSIVGRLHRNAHRQNYNTCNLKHSTYNHLPYTTLEELLHVLKDLPKIENLH